MTGNAAQYCPMCAGELEWLPLGDDQRLHPRCNSCGFVMWQHPFPTVEAVILRRSGSDVEVLLGRRSREPRLGAWDVPGGFLGIGDVPTEVVRRECLAEFNAEVEVGMPVGMFAETFQDQALVGTFFACALTTGTFGPSERADRVEWFDLDALPPLAFDSVHEALAAVRRQPGNALPPN